MTACEKCWGDAYTQARLLGGSQVDHYQALLVERTETHDVIFGAETDESATSQEDQ